MLKRNGFGKRTKSIRKPDIAVLMLASLTVILLLAWGGLYWQDRSADAAVAQGNDDIELPVIMLDLDAAKESQESDSGKGNEPVTEPVGEAASQEPGKLLENQDQSTEELPGKEAGGPKLSSPSQGTDSADEGASVPVPEMDSSASGNDNGAAQIHVGTSSETTSSPAAIPPSKPTQEPEAGAVVTNKPSSTPATSEQPSDTPSSKPSVTPMPVESINELEQQYELELLDLQAGCIMDVKSVLKEAETQMGKVDTSDTEALQRIGSEAALNLEAAGGTCNTNFNEVAARAAQAGVSAEQIEEWRQTFNEVMEQLQVEADQQLRI